jgi:glucose-6-phosphate 1-epimerase
MPLQLLNERFGIKGGLEFVQGKGDLVFAQIHTDKARALISLYAGQVLSFRPTDAAVDMFFLSDKAYYQSGKAIKGGVPVCWPWFGPDPEGAGRPAHGFARISAWNVVETHQEDDGAIRLSLDLKLNDVTRTLWSDEIEARLDILVGDVLSITLTTFNKGKEAVNITQGLHTYFKVGDIGSVGVTGLDNHRYLDKVDEGKEKVQKGDVVIDGEVDRIYLNADEPLAIHDTSLKRKINITSSGSNSAVVWNPWAAISKSMADLEDEDYKRMICVETTNAAPDVVHLAAGESYALSATYSLVAME